MTATVIGRLRHHASRRDDAPAYYEAEEDRWNPTSWRTFEEQVSVAGRSLMALGVGPGDRVAILGGNRARWSISALGTMACGGVVVGVYPTCSAEQVDYILRHASAKVLIVDDPSPWQTIDHCDDPRAVKHVVAMDGMASNDPGSASDAVLDWSTFRRLAEEVEASALEVRTRAITARSLATLIYTSGTTGQPKAVMLSHGNLVETSRIIGACFDLNKDDVAVSYLPLAHIAEQTVSIHMAVHVGFAVYFLPDPTQLAATLGVARPTIFFGVPRVWERLHAAVTGKLDQARGLKRWLARWALTVGAAREERDHDEMPPSLGLRVKVAIAERLVLRRARQALGFSRLRLCASGAAPIGREILAFFGQLGISIYEVYGLSESSGPGTWNRPGAIRLGTVGPPLPGVDVRIAADGEVLMRGPNVFQGYLDDLEQTATTLIDGWLHTGDLGAFDDEGFLTITGRKKEILITSGGKNIAPAGIESALRRIDVITDAVVVGDGRRHVAALLTLDVEVATRYQSREDVAPAVDAAAPATDPAVRAVVQAGVDSVNARLARVEHVRAFHILPRPFTVEASELTPTLKVRRVAVHARYADAIDAMYRPAQGSGVE